MTYKADILRLRSEGKTYDQIVKELGCVKSTVAYYCGDEQARKSKVRLQTFRKNNPLSSKVDFFRRVRRRRNKRQDRLVNIGPDKVLYEKTLCFQRRDGKDYIRGFSVSDLGFTTKDVLKKFGRKTKCYLTGRPIDLLKTHKYSFDHKIPATRGGSNNIDNLGITCSEANLAKSNLTPDEFIQLCKEVVEHNGYEVKKKT